MLLLSALSVTSEAMADNVYPVRGRVIDEWSRQPVIGAYVYVMKADSLKAVTDTAGVFVFPSVSPGMTAFRVEADGFM